MDVNSFFIQNGPLLIIAGLWELVWKSVALWKAAQSNRKYWFIAIIFINTIGILPILYLVFFEKKKK